MLIFCIHQLCINIWIFATMKYKNRWIQLCMFLFNLFQIDSENVMHLLALPSTGSHHKMYYWQLCKKYSIFRLGTKSMGLYKVLTLAAASVRISRAFANWWNSSAEKLTIYLYICMYYIFGIHILCWINPWIIENMSTQVLFLQFLQFKKN